MSWGAQAGLEQLPLSQSVSVLRRGRASSWGTDLFPQPPLRPLEGRDVCTLLSLGLSWAEAWVLTWCTACLFPGKHRNTLAHLRVKPAPSQCLPSRWGQQERASESQRQGPRPA